MQEDQNDIANREQARTRLSTVGRKYFKFIEFDASEQLVTEIRKHPFGLFLVIVTGAFVGLALLGITLVVAGVDLNSFFNTDALNRLKPILVSLIFVLLLVVIVMTLIGVFLYTSNVIFVTSEKIAQVLYVSLFDRKISQLSIGDVQDVTVNQKGIFAHIFNYGTLVIETAGEQQNYTFTFVPDPYQVLKMIVGSHERNLTQYGN